MTGSACAEAEPCDQDDIGELRSSFAFCGLLLLDTYDSYRHCDGDRIFRNAKFEFLLYDVSHHYKYRLNIWRMMARDMALLSAREAYEYKWNCSVNLQGGTGNNIPNDNMLELNIDKVKRRLKAQGSNMTYESAKVACDTIQMHQLLSDQILRESKSHKGSKRPDISKLKDVQVIANNLRDAGYMQHKCNRKSEYFRCFTHPLKRVKVPELCQWIDDNKRRAAVEMSTH